MVLEKYRVDSAGTHYSIIPDKDVSYYIADKKARCGELRIDDGRHISAEQRKKIYATIRETVWLCSGRAERMVEIPSRRADWTTSI